MGDLWRHFWIRETGTGPTSGPTPWQIYDDDDDDEGNGSSVNADNAVKYKQNSVKHNAINAFIKLYFLHCFFQRHVSAVVMSHLQVDYISY